MSDLMILNVGAGDTKLSFDPKNKAERKHAAKVVTDMLNRGYAILVEAGQDGDGETLYRRVTAFDEKTCEYLIVGLPEDMVDETAEAAPRRKAPKTRKAATTRRIRAEGSRAVAVARTAGG